MSGGRAELDPHHHSTSSMQQQTEVATSIAVYSTCSVSLIILNKLVIDTYNLDYPMGLLFLQNLSAVLLVAFFKKLGYVHYPDFSWAVVKKWMPLTILFVAMIWTSMKSLKLMSVAAQTIVKNLAIILTAIGDWHFFKKRLTPGMFVSFIIMIIGSYLGSVGDRWVTTEGLAWTFANIFATCSYVLYMKLLLNDLSKEIGGYGPVFYNNLLSLPFILPSCVTSFAPMWHDILEAPPAAILFLVLKVVASSVITFASFWCMKVTSPTTYSVCGALNKIPLAFLGMIIFHHYPTTTGYIGVFVGLGGGLFYAWLNRPQQHQNSQQHSQHHLKADADVSALQRMEQGELTTPTLSNSRSQSVSRRFSQADSLEHKES